MEHPEKIVIKHVLMDGTSVVQGYQSFVISPLVQFLIVTESIFVVVVSFIMINWARRAQWPSCMKGPKSWIERTTVFNAIGAL